ncbi:resolvase [Clostridia bacterium]|nr:resolvase [Clostridia bacterium]
MLQTVNQAANQLAINPNTQPLRAAIYARFSNDDGDTSIGHQQQLMRDYVQKIGGVVVQSYADNGISGTTTKRDGLQQLLADAGSQKFNCIVVNDFSRLARNLSEMSTMRDILLPSLGVRFISINDNFDSQTSDIQNDFIKNTVLDMFNEFWPLQCSQKVRKVKAKMREEGKWMCAAPYGYKQDPNDKNHLVIDNETAPNVRRIFALKLSRMSKQQIADVLNADGIITRARHRNPELNVRYDVWTTSMIDDMLKNPVYTGDTVQGRSTKASYKDHTNVAKEQSEWITVKGTHEPIISYTDFDNIQATWRTYTRRTKDKTTRPFSGLLRCSDCGENVSSSIGYYNLKRTKDVHTTISYNCLTHRTTKTCPSHYIREERLTELVKADITAQVGLIELDEVQWAKQYLAEKNDTGKLQKELTTAEKRLAQLDKLIEAAFERAVLDDVELNRKMLDKYQSEQKTLESQANAITAQLNRIQNSKKDVSEFISAMKQLATDRTLDRDLLVKVIDYIEVPRSKSVDPLKIHYKI